MLIQGHQKLSVDEISEEKSDYMISKDNNNKVNFEKSSAAPISNGTVGPGDEK